MICCNSNEDSEIIKSLRSHGYARGLKNQKKIEKKNKNIDIKFLFINSGYNFRPTDLQAAIGLSQLKSLDKFTLNRSINRTLIINALENDKRWKNHVTFLEANEEVQASWFGIAMLLNKKFLADKKYIIRKINKLGIETRPIISGNFAKQPSVKKYKLIRKSEKFPNADYVDRLGFFIGLSTNKMAITNIKKFKDIFFNAFK